MGSDPHPCSIDRPTVQIFHLDSLGTMHKVYRLLLESGSMSMDRFTSLCFFLEKGLTMAKFQLTKLEERIVPGAVWCGGGGSSGHGNSGGGSGKGHSGGKSGKGHSGGKSGKGKSGKGHSGGKSGKGHSAKGCKR